MNKTTKNIVLSSLLILPLLLVSTVLEAIEVSEDSNIGGEVSPTQQATATIDVNMGNQAFTGVVTQVSSSSFMISSQDEKNATRTYNIRTVPGTAFFSGTNTVRLDDVINGQSVVIFGNASAATDSVTAVRVDLDLDGVKGQEILTANTSTTNAGVFSRLLGWFRRIF